MKKWNVGRKELVYKNPFFSVSEEDLILSNEQIQTYYIINKKNFVSMIAVEGEYIYMTQMDRYTVGKKSLEIPMGAIEGDENPEDAARRELIEEVGLIAEEITSLGILDAAKGHSGQKCFAFLVSNFKKGERNLDIMEKESNLEVVKIKIKDIDDMIKSGRITDIDTIASFHLFMLNYKS